MRWTSISLALVLITGGALVALAPGAAAHHCNGTPCETTPKEAVVHVQTYVLCTIDGILGGDGCETDGPNPGP